MSGRKRKAVTPWEACGESREDYEAWERREFAAALTSAGIDPTLEGAPLVDAMEAAGMLSKCEAEMVRNTLARAEKDGGK